MARPAGERLPMDASLTQGVLLTAQLARMQSRLCLLGRYNLHGYGEKANARESGCDCVLEPRKDENGTCNRQASYVTKIEKKGNIRILRSHDNLPETLVFKRPPQS